ncbi:MAG: hypothetical protein FWE03_03315 [Firmicutes bacterium]|nr:hypothetical protein [Bacillota bacterium]
MKKLISIICAIAIIAAATLGAVHLYNAEASTPFEEESNLVFRKALEEILETEGITAEYITVTIEPVYDINLDHMGFIYFMHYDNYEGFAIVVHATGMFEVAEFFMQAPNPFNDIDGQKVYIGLMAYLVYNDGDFIDIETGYVVYEEIIEHFQEHALLSSNPFNFINIVQTIEFVNRTAAVHDLAVVFPAYAIPNYTPVCFMPTVSSSIIGYWARFFPNLAPFNVGMYIPGGLYVYWGHDDDSIIIINELNSRMGAIPQWGRMPDHFRQGMTSYVNARGRNISFHSAMFEVAMGHSTFNFTAAQQQLRNGRPLMLFTWRFNIASIQRHAGVDGIIYRTSTQPHVMAGFGYNVITYTLANGTQRTDRFLRVATGFDGQPVAFFNVGFHAQIFEAYGVNIF